MEVDSIKRMKKISGVTAVLLCAAIIAGCHAVPVSSNPPPYIHADPPTSFTSPSVEIHIPGDEEYASDWGGWTEWDNAPEWEEYLRQLGESTGETINVPDVPPEDTVPPSDAPPVPADDPPPEHCWYLDGDKRYFYYEGQPVTGWQTMNTVRYYFDENGILRSRAGIDVSSFQRNVDWQAVKASGVEFAFIRAAFRGWGDAGNLVVDPCFEQHIADAAQVGIDCGVYVYSQAVSTEEAREEARFVLDVIEGYTLTYPIVYDTEWQPVDEARTNHAGLNRAKRTEMALAFCDEIRQAGYYPMVYSSKNWMVGKIAATPYDKWIAQYNTVCEYPNPAFWQYSSSGVVAGINGSVDVNYQFKDYSNLIVANGFVDRAGGRYYYKNYRMQYGFIEDGGKRYFMNADGTLYKKGWLGDSLNMMYMDTKDGHMLTDLVEIGGKKYYFDSNGLMQRGMIPLNGKIYLFGADGAMQYGFYSDPTAGTRYFKTDGSMAANELLTVGTNKYYFNTNGVMATGLTNIGGVTYLFGADGAMQYGWYTDASGMRYFQTNGAMAVNTTLAVGGVTYVFDANGLATAVPVINPATWVTDPATGVTIDTATGAVVPAETVAAAAAAAIAQK